jgi:hypothetical protein
MHSGGRWIPAHKDNDDRAIESRLHRSGDCTKAIPWMDYLRFFPLPGNTRGNRVFLKGRYLKRFHNSRALSGIVQGGIFLRKMPLEGSDFGVQQLWNRCSGVASLLYS